MSPKAELRDHQRELYHFRTRLAIGAGFVLALFLILAVRFVYVQVWRHDYYTTLAEQNRISIVPIVPNRGVIYDRNGIVLAHNYSAYTLEITPGKVKNVEDVINELAQLVEISPKDRRRFKKLLDESHNFESLPIRTRLNDLEVARFAVNRYRFPGVEIKARLFRHYPLGELAAHAVGYIGRINDADLEQLEERGDIANYRGTDHIGKTGVEQSYEKQLHGVTGFEHVETDAGGRAVRTLSSTPPVSGDSLFLSLDAKLHEVAARAFGERRGALVAIDPANGEVLALLSRPSFDPNLFVDGIDPTNWDLLNTSPDKPLTNRAIRGVYPPGSTFKPYMALAALELGKRTPSQAISDPGFFNFGGHRFRDDKPGGHGSVDMYKSIVVSCDTYYYMLANDMGIDNISRFMRLFGFGQPTGIDIEGESTGVLPSQEWKQKRFKQKWYAGETISIGIGQGYNSYTPVQLANAMATLAADGVMHRPRVVKTIENARDGARITTRPKMEKTLPLKPENIAIIKEAMAGVNREGTGARSFAGAEYTSAGKTGTAQVIAIKQNEKYVESRVKEYHRDHGLFIAFAPVEQPRIAVAVIAENAGFGAQSAAPITRMVMDYYLLGKVPAKPAAEQSAEEDGHD